MSLPVETSPANVARQCKAKNRRGEPCGAYAIDGSDFCFWHDPAKVQERAQARSEGGKARQGRRVFVNADTGEQHTEVVLETPADVVEVVAKALNDLFKLENSVQRAKAAASLAGVALKALEVADLEARIAALEAAEEDRREQH